MSLFLTLSSSRICLRRWREEDREAFAAMNSDARVMQFFRRRLSRAESDAMVDRIQKDFSERSFGLWAIEVPDVAPFIGFAGDRDRGAPHDAAPPTPPYVRVRIRRVGELRGLLGTREGRVRQRRRLGMQ